MVAGMCSVHTVDKQYNYAFCKSFLGQCHFFDKYIISAISSAAGTAVIVARLGQCTLGLAPYVVTGLTIRPTQKHWHYSDCGQARPVYTWASSLCGNWVNDPANTEA